MITTNRYGSEYNTSTKRINAPSMRPPASPATAPHSTPITRLTAVALSPIASESRVPIMSRLSTSRPYSSVPSQ